MARKGSQPALYELIGRGASRPAPSSGAPIVESTDLAPSVARASNEPAAPPQTLRIPVGYVYGAIFLLLLAIVVSYMYGVAVGQRMAVDAKHQKLTDDMEAKNRMPNVDPLDAGKVPPSLARSQDQDADAKSARGTNADDDLGPASDNDPRQAGLNYFVLAHTAARTGKAIVDFCRKNGLDAHLVSEENAELRLVIVLPGFGSGERKSPAVEALETKIRAVGRKWKNTTNGNRDFGDAYPSKYQPRTSHSRT